MDGGPDTYEIIEYHAELPFAHVHMEQTNTSLYLSLSSRVESLSLPIISPAHQHTHAGIVRMFVWKHETCWLRMSNAYRSASSKILDIRMDMMRVMRANAACNNTRTRRHVVRVHIEIIDTITQSDRILADCTVYGLWAKAFDFN